MTCIAVNGYVARHEIFATGLIAVDKLLRIHIEKREPRRLDLHFHPVSRQKSVGNVGHGKSQFLNMARSKWLGE